MRILFYTVYYRLMLHLSTHLMWTILYIQHAYSYTIILNNTIIITIVIALILYEYCKH